MEALSSTNKLLNAAWANHDKDREARMKKIDDKEKELMERLDELNKKKHKIAQANGNTDATDDDIVEINAGGKIIAAKRVISGSNKLSYSLIILAGLLVLVVIFSVDKSGILLYIQSNRIAISEAAGAHSNNSQHPIASRPIATATQQIQQPQHLSVKFKPFPHNTLGIGQDSACQWTSRNISEAESSTYDYTQQNAIREGVCLSPKLKDKLHIFSTEEAVDCFTIGDVEQIQLVIAGDSYMKQLYIGLVDILIGKWKNNREISNSLERDNVLGIKQSVMLKRHENNPRFPSVRYSCKNECYGQGNPSNFASACSDCIDSIFKTAKNGTRTIAVVGAGIHLKNGWKSRRPKTYINATIQEINTFLHNSITVKKNDIIWVSNPSYQTNKVPFEYQASNNEMDVLYWDSLSTFEKYPYLDVFQLTTSCHMENCSYDGGHRSRYVNRWKAQLLLNMLCEV